MDGSDELLGTILASSIVYAALQYLLIYLYSFVSRGSGKKWSICNVFLPYCELSAFAISEAMLSLCQGKETHPS